MVTAYNQALRQLPPERGAAFRLQHLEWFKTYSRTCNTATDEEQRKACIDGYLSCHTRQVEAKVQRWLICFRTRIFSRKSATHWNAPELIS